MARLRAAASALGLLGALCLLVATAATVIRVTVGGAAAAITHSGWDRHGPALALLAVAAVVLLGIGLRGSRTALAGVAACGLAALAIALAWDAPDLDEVGAVGDVYAQARAHAGAGFYLETAGGVLLLTAGGGLLLAGQPAPARRRRVGADA